MKTKFLLVTLLSLATFFAGAQQSGVPVPVTHQVHDLPVNVAAVYPATVAAITVGTDTNGVLFTFPKGFVPVGLKWTDTNSVIYTYTKNDSVLFKPYPLFNSGLTTPAATAAYKFEAIWEVSKVMSLDTTALGVQKFSYDAYCTQWYLQGFLKSTTLWLGKSNSANWRYFKKTVVVTGYITNQDY